MPGRASPGRSLVISVGYNTTVNVTTVTFTVVLVNYFRASIGKIITTVTVQNTSRPTFMLLHVGCFIVQVLHAVQVFDSLHIFSKTS